MFRRWAKALLRISGRSWQLVRQSITLICAGHPQAAQDVASMYNPRSPVPYWTVRRSQIHPPHTRISPGSHFHVDPQLSVHKVLPHLNHCMFLFLKKIDSHLLPRFTPAPDPCLFSLLEDTSLSQYPGKFQSVFCHFSFSFKKLLPIPVHYYSTSPIYHHLIISFKYHSKCCLIFVHFLLENAYPQNFSVFRAISDGKVALVSDIIRIMDVFQIPDILS